MTTVRDICTRALRKARITAIDQAPDANQFALALEGLNTMMHGWALAGADTEHTTLTADDNFPLAAKFEEGTVYLLAAHLSVTFNFPVGFDADEFMRRLQAAYMVIDEVVMPETLKEFPSQTRYSWIVRT